MPEPTIVYIAVWTDNGELNAQAYTSRQAALRDFGPEADTRLGDAIFSTPLDEVTIIESTVQS